jgi:hypothetical protein
MSLFRALEDAIATRLAAVAPLAGITVVSRRKGSVADAIDTAIAENGRCLFVAAPLPLLCLPNVPGPHFKTADVTVRVIEFPPATPAGGLDAYDLMEYVLRYLHQWKPNVTGAQTLYAPANPVTEVEDRERVIFDLHFHIMLTLEEPSS